MDGERTASHSSRVGGVNVDHILVWRRLPRQPRVALLKRVCIGAAVT